MTRAKTRIEWSRSIFQPPLCFTFSNTQLKHKLFIDASAMPTVQPIDEDVRTDQTRRQPNFIAPPCPDIQPASCKETSP